MQAVVWLSDAGQEDEARELLKNAANYQDAEDKLAGYVDEVKAGRIVRARLGQLEQMKHHLYTRCNDVT